MKITAPLRATLLTSCLVAGLTTNAWTAQAGSRYEEAPRQQNHKNKENGQSKKHESNFCETNKHTSGAQSEQNHYSKRESSDAVASWFSKYDAIRREAQMTPEEKEQADDLLDKGFLVLLPGFGRISAQKLLKNMIAQYQKAIKALESLPELPETRELHRGYKDYFSRSHSVFKDSRSLISNPLIRLDAGSLKKDLKNRKEAIQSLESHLKEMDHELRQKYKIAPYCPKTSEAEKEH